MSELSGRHCKPCEGGVDPLAPAQASALLSQLDGWQLSATGSAIEKQYRFRNFYQTIAFVNAVAWIANSEDHHPDIEAGYSRCLIRYTTHAIKGLSENDFICAARIDALGTV